MEEEERFIGPVLVMSVGVVGDKGISRALVLVLLLNMAFCVGSSIFSVEEEATWVGIKSACPEEIATSFFRGGVSGLGAWSVGGGPSMGCC